MNSENWKQHIDQNSVRLSELSSMRDEQLEYLIDSRGIVLEEPIVNGRGIPVAVLRLRRGEKIQIGNLQDYKIWRVLFANSLPYSIILSVDESLLPVVARAVGDRQAFTVAVKAGRVDIARMFYRSRYVDHNIINAALSYRGMTEYLLPKFRGTTSWCDAIRDSDVVSKVESESWLNELIDCARTSDLRFKSSVLEHRVDYGDLLPFISNIREVRWERITAEQAAEAARARREMSYVQDILDNVMVTPTQEEIVQLRRIIRSAPGRLNGKLLMEHVEYVTPELEEAVSTLNMR